MNDIILHIGHGKTGSSYLQSALALNKDKLLDLGIIYPEDNSFDDAKKGNITMGIFNYFKKNYLNLDLIAQKDCDILISSEAIFQLLYLKETWIIDFLKKYNKRIKIIIYTRNPFEHIFSSWGQRVKRHSEVRDIDTFLMQTGRYSVYKTLLNWLDLSDEFNFKIIVRNYSNYKHNLWNIFLNDILNVNQKNIDFILPQKQVNRSLTFSEYEIQRVFNHSQMRPPVSNFLVNELPNYKASTIKCKRESYDYYKSWQTENINKVNERINPDESIIIESPEMVAYDTEELITETLSIDQIELISFYLKNNIRNNIIKSNSVDLIRDISLKISRNQSLDLSDALSLMKIAQVFRPDGPLINSTIDKWKKKLEVKKLKE